MHALPFPAHIEGTVYLKFLRKPTTKYTKYSLKNPLDLDLLQANALDSHQAFKAAYLPKIRKLQG